MFSSLSNAASSAASWAMGSSSAEDADGDGGDVVDPTKLFHEYPHPSDWRDRVKEVLENLRKTNTAVPPNMCPMGDIEATCRRFLVARRYNVEAAESMLRKAIEFRASVQIGDAKGVDNIMKAPPRWDLLELARKILPNTPFHCYTKQGYPVYLLRVGKGDSSLALDVPDEVHVYSTLVRGEHMIRSIIPDATENAKKLVEGKTKEEIKENFCAVNQDTKSQMVDKQVVLLDLKDVGLSAMKCLYVFKIVNSTASHNFPELSKAIYVLNAPTVFDYLYAAVKPFLAAHTQHKVKVFSDPKLQYEALQKLLEDKDIPDFLVPSEDLVPGRHAGFTDGAVTNQLGEGYLPETVKKQNEWINAQASSTYAAATSPKASAAKENAFKEESGDGGDALGGTIEKINIMNLADGQPSKE
mmetsp:Transcript_8261/g.24307  ORF Transcript_8261/g.24307 Transcript_8261/m.24307 type:complete len:413 (+) Transcript_8261:124-1362(+)